MNAMKWPCAIFFTPPSIQQSVYFPPFPPYSPLSLLSYLIGDALLLHLAHVTVVDLLPYQDLVEDGGRGEKEGEIHECVCAMKDRTGMWRCERGGGKGDERERDGEARGKSSHAALAHSIIPSCLSAYQHAYRRIHIPFHLRCGGRGKPCQRSLVQSLPGRRSLPWRRACSYEGGKRG